MSSVSRLNGFRPVKTITGAPYNGAANVYFIPASDSSVVMVGDAVKLLGDGRAATGVATVTRVSAGTDVPVGVVVGILFSGVGDAQNIPPVNDLNTPVYRRASTDRYVLVADDPNLIYEAQYLGTSVAAATITANIGQNAQIDVTAGSTSSGSSGMSVSTTLGTTATLPLKIVGFPQRPDNIPGDTYFSYWVKLNQVAYGTGTGSTGY
jgi:hypothetical protein